MERIKVSVIMGVYNTQDVNILCKAIDSILNQTLKEFEFIICNDGSLDNTIDVLRSFEKKDSRIILLDNDDNKGLAYSLNRCIRMSKGKYIARMDADDISLENRLEQQYNFLENNLDYVLVGCCSKILRNNNSDLVRKVKESPTVEDFLWGSPFMHPTIMVKTEVYKKLNGYRLIKQTRRAEDLDFFMRLYQMGYRGYNLQEPYFIYREEKDDWKKRKYRYRIDEFQLRLINYKKMDLMPRGYIYSIKPLVVGLIPGWIIRLLRRN